MNKYPWLDAYLLDKPGAEKDYKEEWGWDRYRVGGKMFAAVCTPGKPHAAYGGRTLINLKCEPAMAEILRKTYEDVIPGFYCDKRNWNAVYLDGAVPDDELRRMLDDAYRLVFQKLTQKAQREILEAT